MKALFSCHSLRNGRQNTPKFPSGNHSSDRRKNANTCRRIPCASLLVRVQRIPAAKLKDPKSIKPAPTPRYSDKVYESSRCVSATDEKLFHQVHSERNGKLVKEVLSGQTSVQMVGALVWRQLLLC